MNVRTTLGILVAVPFLMVATIVFAASAPNNDCGSSERNAQSITGPDGGTYLTYAGQRDDIRPNGTTGTFCYFGVEHGTNPRAVGIPTSAWPAYNSVTAKAGVPVENEQGFKSAGFIADGKRVLFTIHRESGSGVGHACASFHETHIAVVDDATGELLYRRSWLADYGPALYNRDDNLIFRPSTCPNQYEDYLARATDRTARHLEPVKDAPDGQGMITYNPWQFGPIYSATGLGGFVQHNRLDASYVCRYAGPLDWCASASATGTKGIKTRILSWQARVYANGAASGDFCTDPYGMAVQACGQPDSIKQFTKPGLNWDRRSTALVCMDLYSENGRLALCGDDIQAAYGDVQDVSNRLKADKN